MSHEGYHEPYEKLSQGTLDMHRAIISLMEELEAIDWYAQRADVCGDDELRAVLVHNKNEEIEHAMMTLEWIRRQNEVFDANMSTYLFADGPITEIEGAAKEGSSGEASNESGKGDKNGKSEKTGSAPPAHGSKSAAKPPAGAGRSSSRSGSASDGSLGVGSLRG